MKNLALVVDESVDAVVVVVVVFAVCGVQALNEVTNGALPHLKLLKISTPLCLRPPHNFADFPVD